MPTVHPDHFKSNDYGPELSIAEVGEVSLQPWTEVHPTMEIIYYEVRDHAGYPNIRPTA